MGKPGDSLWLLSCEAWGVVCVSSRAQLLSALFRQTWWKCMHSFQGVYLLMESSVGIWRGSRVQCMRRELQPQAQFLGPASDTCHSVKARPACHWIPTACSFSFSLCFKTHWGHCHFWITTCDRAGGVLTLTAGTLSVLVPDHEMPFLHPRLFPGKQPLVLQDTGQVLYPPGNHPLPPRAKRGGFSLPHTMLITR